MHICISHTASMNDMSLTPEHHRWFRRGLERIYEGLICFKTQLNLESKFILQHCRQLFSTVSTHSLRNSHTGCLFNHLLKRLSRVSTLKIAFKTVLRMTAGAMAAIKGPTSFLVYCLLVSCCLVQTEI